MKIDFTTGFDIDEHVIVTRRMGRGNTPREAKGRVIAFELRYMNGGAKPFVEYHVEIESPRKQQWHVVEEQLRRA